MTLPTWGQLTTRDIAEQLYENPSAWLATDRADVHRLVKKRTGISIPGDFYGKGWGQQMNDLAPDAYNQGNASNMKPTYMDRRSDGNSNQQYPNVALDGSKTYYGGVYLYNRISNGSPRDVGFNGYYVLRSPFAQGQFNLNARADYELEWQYGPQGCRVSMNLFGFSAGYLSGNRKTLSSNSRTSTSSGQLILYNYADLSYPHVCVNLSLWQGGQGTSIAKLWDGWVS
jgi:hypothetical protein